MVDTFWTVAHRLITGAEWCRLSRTTDGWRLSGRVVAVLEGVPVHVRYQVDADAGWLTRHVQVINGFDGDEPIELSRRDGAWVVDGEPLTEVEGATDVDLGVSPSTNTLPIRRLGLEIGESAEIAVAWIRFPDMRVERGRQIYERLSETVWRYSSGAFSAELTVDGTGSSSPTATTCGSRSPLGHLCGLHLEGCDRSQAAGASPASWR